MTAAPAVDVVEVLLGTATDPALTTAAVAWGLTAAAVTVGLAGGRPPRGRDPVPEPAPAPQPDPAPRSDLIVARTAWSGALAAGAVLLTALLAGGAAITDRRVSAAAATVLVAAVLLVRERVLDRAAGERAVLGGVLLLAAAAGAPAAGSPTQLLVVAAGLGAAVLLTALLLHGVRTWVTHAPALTAAALVLVIGGPTGWVQARPDLPPYQHQRVVLADAVLDITVAPVAPGRNELHVYAWRSDGAELAVHDLEVTVDGAPSSRHTLLEVTPNHHLSYVLELPSGEGWTLELTGTTLDGARLHHDLEVARP